MSKKAKVIPSLLIVSIIFSSTIYCNSTKARNSRPVIVNNDFNSLKDKSNKNSSSSHNNELNLNTNKKPTNNNIINNNSTNDITEFLKILNSNNSLTMEDISSLAAPISNSYEFIEKFKINFPKLNAYRKLSPIDNNYKNYLDINSNSVESIPSFLNESNSIPSIYSEQTTCFTLLNEINSSLSDIKSKISKEPNSTIFSLMPTIMVFEDTHDILSLEYSSIVKNNSSNHSSLNIILKDTEEKLYTLLSSINEFKIELPDLIETLNSLI